MIMITFPNTHSAILGEQKLLAAGMCPLVMPMPQSVSAGCGICLRLPHKQQSQAAGILAAAGVATEGWYAITQQGGKQVYTPIPLEQ